MICEAKFADLFDCCVMDKKCSGANCMAWIKETKFSEKPQKAPFGHPEIIETGKGYCGRAR